ncbi:ferredoxin [Oceanicella sp. SM1341]|uniref:ferredoxin n=1 Tax=Oceanicella sp. SM1341 TaxID=1548889 RepID=UPI000E500B91|nr:ferredoxin [Oceanicella sp. SM1341]
MTADDLIADAARSGLVALGPVAPGAGAPVPPGSRSLVLLQPDGPRFWPVFAASPEAADGGPHPLDRWSRRVVGGLAARAGGTALFPFDGPPWPPFLRWLQAAGAAVSPTGLLVHPRAGLWLSCRGAVALAAPAPEPPCARCPTRPCRSACPVGAFGAGGYDVAACVAHISGPAGADCLLRGCRARHACPAGAGFTPLPAQAAHHMKAFLAARRGPEGDDVASV